MNLENQIVSGKIVWASSARAQAIADIQWRETSARVEVRYSNGEFDPGSGRTLAACLNYASRAGPICEPQGER